MIAVIRRAILHFVGRYRRRTYSQEGEDIALDRLLGLKKVGFYVDVGAHHPSRFSNTYAFYRKGWRGINIDAAPGSMCLFNLTRPRDLNLEIAIGEIEGEVNFEVFDEGLLSTADKELACERRASGLQSRTAVIPSRRLESVLDQHLPDGTLIDFLSVDVEGLDLSVLRSNDWLKYRPAFVVAEALGESIESLLKSEMHSYMQSIGYTLLAKLVHSVIYRDGTNQTIEFV